MSKPAEDVGTGGGGIGEFGTGAGVRSFALPFPLSLLPPPSFTEPLSASLSLGLRPRFLGPGALVAGGDIAEAGGE